MTSSVSNYSGAEATVARPWVVRARSARSRGLVGVGVATVLAFVVSAVWYAAWGEPYQQLRGADASTAMPWWLVPAELGRSLVVAAAVTVGVRAIGPATWRATLGAAFLTWLAFPVVLLVGSVLHEGVPALLAAIHAGDWLVKLVAITLVVQWFARRSR